MLLTLILYVIHTLNNMYKCISEMFELQIMT